jgi:hypothetical protein
MGDFPWYSGRPRGGQNQWGSSSGSERHSSGPVRRKNTIVEIIRKDDILIRRRQSTFYLHLAAMGI